MDNEMLEKQMMDGIFVYNCIESWKILLRRSFLLGTAFGIVALSLWKGPSFIKEWKKTAFSIGRIKYSYYIANWYFQNNKKSNLETLQTTIDEIESHNFIIHLCKKRLSVKIQNYLKTLDLE